MHFLISSPRPTVSHPIRPCVMNSSRCLFLTWHDVSVYVRLSPQSICTLMMHCTAYNLVPLLNTTFTMLPVSASILVPLNPLWLPLLPCMHSSLFQPSLPPPAAASTLDQNSSLYDDAFIFSPVKLLLLLAPPTTDGFFPCSHSKSTSPHSSSVYHASPY